MESAHEIEQLKAERDEAGRRAGAAERKLAYAQESIAALERDVKNLKECLRYVSAERNRLMDAFNKESERTNDLTPVAYLTRDNSVCLCKTK